MSENAAMSHNFIKTGAPISCIVLILQGGCLTICCLSITLFSKKIKNF
jgi:hypothetical protein